MSRRTGSAEFMSISSEYVESAGALTTRRYLPVGSPLIAIVPSSAVCTIRRRSLAPFCKRTSHRVGEPFGPVTFRRNSPISSAEQLAHQKTNKIVTRSVKPIPLLDASCCSLVLLRHTQENG